MTDHISQLEKEVNEFHEQLGKLTKDRDQLQLTFEQSKKENQSKDSGVQEMVIKLSMQTAQKDRQLEDLRKTGATKDKQIQDSEEKIKSLGSEI